MTATLLFGTDGSPDCNAALRYAVAEAAAHAFELVVVLSYQGPLDPDLDDFDTPKADNMAARENQGGTCAGSGAGGASRGVAAASNRR